MKKKEVDKARLACETELTLLHESVKEVDILLESSKKDVDEFNRLSGFKVDLVSKINKYDGLLKEVNFVAKSLYENTPLPSDTKLAEVINEYKVVSEALELHRTNIVSSLNNKGLAIPSDTKLSGVPEQILKLPTLGGDLQINPPNVGAMIDTKDIQYEVSKITPVILYDYSKDPTELFNTNVTQTISSVDTDKDGFSYLSYIGGIMKRLPDGSADWVFDGFSNGVTTVVVGKNGFVYGGSNDNTIRKISTDGEEVWYFSVGNNVKQIVVDDNGFVYSCDAGRYVKKISPDGKEVWSFIHPSTVTCIAVDSKFNVYIGSVDTYVRKISPDCEEVWNYKDPNNGTISVLDIDSDDCVYYATGRVLTQLTLEGSRTWSSSYSYDIIALSTDEYGAIYSCFKNNYILKFDANHTQIFLVSFSAATASLSNSNGYFVVSGGSSYFRRYKDNYTVSIEMEIQKR
ncbi:hypothetical protein [Metaclostridioides mangenotii]|uniref:hypothetical protein n=1 Tax=Metaclostridioides mangenotii TaxID=1540 RepID=UPI00068C8322|nr:hypothetical protein [Clostridioides mangenotii]